MVTARPYQALALAFALLLSTAATAQRAPAPPPVDEVPIAILVDISSGQVLHARNPDRRFVPASITKVMTLFTAFQLIEEGELDPRQMMTVQEDTWREWHGKGSTMWIGEDDVVSVDTLLMGIANVSANDASIFLAEGEAGSVKAWTDEMNRQARELGMENSHFGTPNGWPDEGGTFTTANDLVTLARAMLYEHPAKYRRYVGRPGFSYGGIEQRNHDPLIGRLRGADGIKTGFTNEAGYGFLGTAQRGGQRLVMVVAGADRATIRNRAAKAYMEWGFSAFDRERLFEEGAVVGTARVQGGDARRVNLIADRAVAVNVPTGRMGELRASIIYDGPLRAPFEQGEEVATLVIDVPGMEPARIPLVAGESVAEAGFFTRMFNGVAGWLS